MLDLTFNVPTLLTAAIAIIAFIVWLIRMESRVAAADKAARDALFDLAEAGKRTESVHGLLTLYKEQFHEYQLKAATEFMTQSAVSAIKGEVLSEIARMESRLETQIERLSKGART